MPEPLPFEEVYARFAERVYRFCRWQVQDPVLAEDIAAETFVAAYTAYGKSKPDPETVHLWLFRIARNLVTDHRRREKRRDRIMQILGRANSREDSVEHIAETNAELVRGLMVISKMKDRERRLIALRIGGGLSYRDIGETLGMAEDAARTATSRAIERFRRLVEDAR